jgi:hypothetical protein
MQFALILCVFAAAASACADTPSYDTAYDASSTPLEKVACSTGTHGLMTKGYTTFGSLPSFPRIGGGQAVAGYNSASCGTCWALTYNGTGTAKTTNILLVDHANEGFNVAREAMDELTNGMAVILGRVDVDAKQVNATECGMH